MTGGLADRETDLHDEDFDSDVVWADRSFFLEIKPRSDLASLFVDCPQELQNDCTSTANLVSLRADCIQLGIPSEIREKLDTLEQLPIYRAKLAELTFDPSTVVSPTWSDNHRLFMCKVKVTPHKQVPYASKHIHRIATDLCRNDPLKEFIKFSNESEKDLRCGLCDVSLIGGASTSYQLGFLPEDEWLQTSPSVDYFCRDTCGSSCDPQKHSRGQRIETESAHHEWLPSSNRIMISHQYVSVHAESLGSSVVRESGVVQCSRCQAQLGIELKNNCNLFNLHHLAVSLFSGGKTFLSYRFHNRSVFYTQLLLSLSESRSSLKLVIRSLDKVPQLLLWFLDDYCIFTNGKLHDSDNSALIPYSVVKVLYKVFTAATASSDPRANGEDASVGFADLPQMSCTLLTEHLLNTSLVMPPACRSVGQFYVGFLPTEDVKELKPSSIC